MPLGQKRTVKAVSVGIGVNALVLGANNERLTAVIINNSAGVVYLGKDATVAVANGLPLAANASFTDVSSIDDWWVFNGQAGAADIRVLEVTE
jgi:hypothetical protein